MLSWKQILQRIAPFSILFVVCCLGIIVKNKLNPANSSSKDLAQNPQLEESLTQKTDPGTHQPQAKTDSGQLNSPTASIPKHNQTPAARPSQNPKKIRPENNEGGLLQLIPPNGAAPNSHDSRQSSQSQSNAADSNSVAASSGNNWSGKGRTLPLTPRHPSQAAANLPIANLDPQQTHQAVSDLPKLGVQNPDGQPMDRYSAVLQASSDSDPNQTAGYPVQQSRYPSTNDRFGSFQSGRIPSNYLSSDPTSQGNSEDLKSLRNPFFRRSNSDFQQTRQEQSLQDHERSVLESVVSFQTELSDFELQIVQNHLDSATKYARKEAFLSSVNETENALRVIAKSRQRGGQDRRSVEKLNLAFQAYKELADFATESSLNGFNVETIVKGHNTPVLKEHSSIKDIDIRFARDRYLLFAEKNLFESVGRHPIASQALHTLGKINLVQSNRKTTSPSIHYAKAGSMFKVSLQSDQRNSKSANDLGVWLAQQNQLQDAKTLLVQSVKTSPMFSEAWQNLSTVHSRLGEDELAAIAGQQARIALAEVNQVKNVQSRRGNIAFVSAEEFAKAGQTPTMRPDQAPQNQRRIPNSMNRQSRRQQGSLPSYNRPVGFNAISPNSNQSYFPPKNNHHRGSATSASEEKGFLMRSWENRPRLRDMVPSWGKNSPKPTAKNNHSNYMKFGGF